MCPQTDIYSKIARNNHPFSECTMHIQSEMWYWYATGIFSACYNFFFFSPINFVIWFELWEFSFSFAAISFNFLLLVLVFIWTKLVTGQFWYARQFLLHILRLNEFLSALTIFVVAKCYDGTPKMQPITFA